MLLKAGDNNSNVKVWQVFLDTLGYQLAADGDFGPATERATRSFQTANALKADGVVGDDTIAAARAKGFAGFPESEVETQEATLAIRKVSRRGLDFIKSFEREILKVYDDGYGFPTVGVGHLVKPHDGLKLGDRITKEQSDEFFARDVAEHAEPVNRLVKVPLTQGQYDALVSLVFNIGGGNFAQSSILRKLNEGDYAGAKAHFDDWIKSNGQVSRGLVRRRNEEQAMFDS